MKSTTPIYKIKTEFSLSEAALEEAKYFSTSWKKSSYPKLYTISSRVRKPAMLFSRFAGSCSTYSSAGYWAMNGSFIFVVCSRIRFSVDFLGAVVRTILCCTKSSPALARVLPMSSSNYASLVVKLSGPVCLPRLFSISIPP